MTHRERVLAAIAHEEPDRTPVDFGAMRSTGIMAIAYNKLKAHLGMTGGVTKLYDLMQQLAEPEMDVLDRMGGDVVQVHRLEPSFGIDIREWKESTLPDGSPCIVPKGFNPVEGEDGSLEIRSDGKLMAKRSPNALYYELEDHPLAEATTAKDIDAFNWSVMTVEEVEFLRAQAEYWRANTDYAILGCFGGNILENGQFMFGYQRFMELLVTDLDLVEYFLDKLTENHIQNLERYIEAVGDSIDVIQVGDDLGAQDALQISPEMYREVIKPRHAEVYRYIKENSDFKIFLHSCGAIADIIPDLIEIGVDIINPVQTSAKGMAPQRLKREFGKHITFWGGGCDTQQVLPFGSVDDVVKDVKRRLEIFKPGGGFVFTQIHNIQADIPPEKVLAMYDAVKEFGGY